MGRLTEPAKMCCSLGLTLKQECFQIVKRDRKKEEGERERERERGREEGGEEE